MRFFNRIILMSCVLIALGCSGKSEVTHKLPQALSVKSADAIKEAKPGASVKMISGTLIYINSNEKTDFDILLEASETGGSLNIEFSPSEGLNLLSTPYIQTMAFTSKIPITVPVTLLANKGRHYLNMHITLSNGDDVTVRNLALIVEVGEDKKSGQQQKITGASVIRLPAQETISKK